MTIEKRKGGVFTTAREDSLPAGKKALDKYWIAGDDWKKKWKGQFQQPYETESDGQVSILRCVPRIKSSANVYTRPRRLQMGRGSSSGCSGRSIKPGSLTRILLSSQLEF